MFTDVNDKTLVFTPKALDTIRDWLTQIETTVGQGAYASEMARKAAQSRITALSYALSSGFGNAARVTSDTPEGSLFVAEYAGNDSESAVYVFGCVAHSDGTIGVHS